MHCAQTQKSRVNRFRRLRALFIRAAKPARWLFASGRRILPRAQEKAMRRARIIFGTHDRYAARYAQKARLNSPRGLINWRTGMGVRKN